ncbi:MAG: hypothetical protein SCM11_13355 [Bacillota bacterium]|nr:hypothetical protein [Bacillota bacterium]
MKSHIKIADSDVLNWAKEAKLDLPDQWKSIQQNLPQHPKQNIAEKDIGLKSIYPKMSQKKLLIACTVFAVLILIGGLLISGRLGEWLWSANDPGNHYTQATADSAATTESGKTTTSTSTYSNEELAFSDKANAQFALMEQSNIPDQYQYYAGCYIEDLQMLIINVTSNPEEFKTKYADLLDFSIIEVRQVKYSLKELELAYAPLYKEFSSSDKLTKLGVYGMAIFEQDNAIKIVVPKVTDKIRQSVAEIIPDTGMVVFEVNGETFPY